MERSSIQLRIGWAALGFFALAVVLALLKVTTFGLACVAVGGVLSVVALVVEFRQRRAVQRAVQRGETRIFPEGGTFGARRSPQTHNKMM